MTTFTDTDTKAAALAALNDNFSEVDDKLTGASPVDLDVTTADVTTFKIGGTTVTATAAQMNQLGDILDRLDALEGGTPTVATPTFSPVAGSYGSTQNVTISCATSGADIYYTVDGSTPTSGSTPYSTAVSVAASETVKAIAVKASYTDSAVGSAAYTISGGGGGYTLLYDGITSGTDNWDIGNTTNHAYAGILKFTDSVSRTIGKVSAKLTKNGSISGKTFRAKIWSMTGDDLNATLATSDDVTGDDAWNLTAVDFIFSTPYATTGSTFYGITIEMVGGADATNYASGYRTTSDIIPGDLGFWNSTKGLVNDFAAYDFQMALYTTP